MCPDRQIISLYHDGELPSPWKEKLEAHLKTCLKCRVVLSGYRNITDDLREYSRETVMAARDRVWRKFTAPDLIVTERAGGQNSPRPVSEKRIWKRTITLPLPAAAAAAIFVIFGFFILFGIRSEKPAPAQEYITAGIGAGIGLDDHGMLPPIQDMNEVLRYLSSQNSSDFMIIRLPESRKFSRSGEPTLINAADYPRGRSSR